MANPAVSGPRLAVLALRLPTGVGHIRELSLPDHFKSLGRSARARARAANHRSNRCLGVIRRPDELAPVVLRELDPGLKPLFGLQEVPHAHQEPGLDGLAVPAALAVARGTAEVNGSEIGSVHIEQRQRRVAVGPAGSVAGTR